MLKNFLLVAIGGATGSVLRYAAGLLINNKTFPYATLAVNIIGSFLIGLVFACSLKSDSFRVNWQLLLATGLCGGFTTFSAFTLENLQLIQNGRLVLSAIYILASVIIGMVAVWLGYSMIKR